MTDLDPERIATKDEWETLLNRMVGHYHPGRNVEDFTEWGAEIRRPFGSVPYAVLLRAWSLWKMNQNKLPITSLFKTAVAEAQKEVTAENAKRLPAPKGYTGGARPVKADLEYAFCVGAARLRILREGVVSEPTDADVQTVWDERRDQGIEIGDLTPRPRRMDIKWKEAGEIMRSRRTDGVLTPRAEAHLKERIQEEDDEAGR